VRRGRVVGVLERMLLLTSASKMVKQRGHAQQSGCCGVRVFLRALRAQVARLLRDP